ncbi:MAG TPA: hypothetical protein VIV60_30490 [Polyangiaceae bacterium]
MTREITIIPVLNGYICNVGCQRVVFQDRNQMILELNKYLENPDEVEKEYIKNAVNKTQDMPRNCEVPPPSVLGGLANVTATGVTTTAQEERRR